jgi:AraC-like DNA-binding protein
VAGGDDCTVLSLDDGVARGLLARHAPGDAERAHAPFPERQLLSTPRAHRLQYELLAHVRRGARLELEDCLAELLDEALAPLGTAAAARPSRPSRPSHAARLRELAEAARLELHRDPERGPSQEVQAARLGCSPFHLSRVFAQVSGLSLRAYASRVRARAAAALLCAGPRDLTTLALRLGYADHSHFTNAFRKEWGVTPWAFRATARA